jgi:hypothetical protein
MNIFDWARESPVGPNSSFVSQRKGKVTSNEKLRMTSTSVDQRGLYDQILRVRVALQLLSKEPDYNLDSDV